MREKKYRLGRWTGKTHLSVTLHDAPLGHGSRISAVTPPLQYAGDISLRLRRFITHIDSRRGQKISEINTAAPVAVLLAVAALNDGIFSSLRIGSCPSFRLFIELTATSIKPLSEIAFVLDYLVLLYLWTLRIPFSISFFYWLKLFSIIY